MCEREMKTYNGLGCTEAMLCVNLTYNGLGCTEAMLCVHVE